jgi:hypothetical protein
MQGRSAARPYSFGLGSSSPPRFPARLGHIKHHFLPAMSPWLLRHADREDALANFAGLASMAAAVTLNAGNEAYNAVKILQLGRGIIANLLSDVRTGASNLEKEHPGLTKEFISFRNKVESAGYREKKWMTEGGSGPVPARKEKGATGNGEELCLDFADVKCYKTTALLSVFVLSIFY